MTGDHRVVAPVRCAVNVRQVHFLQDGGLDGQMAGPGERTTAKQVPVKMFTEHAADKVQGHRVHTRVDET